MLRSILARAVSKTIKLIWHVVGFTTRSYVDDEAVPLYVNNIFSDNTQLQFNYYNLPFICPPTGQKHAGSSSGKSVSLNLGEVLQGDRIMTSDYELFMGQDKECQYLGSRHTDREGVKRARELVEDGYVVEFILDNLPGATSFVTVDKSHKYYAAGFKLGYKDYSPTTGKPRYFINNHLTFVVRWRKAPGHARNRGGKLVVGFEVYTKSVQGEHRDPEGCPHEIHGDDLGMELYMTPNKTHLASQYPYSSYLPENDDIDDGTSVIIPYTYAVYFREDERIEWSKRWDLYFNNKDESSGIHWLAIINSLVISSLLTAVVVMILGKTTVDGCGGYKECSTEEGKIKLKLKKQEKQPTVCLEQKGETYTQIRESVGEESVEGITGWKLLHADIFRKPRFVDLLAPLIGSGTQLIFMTTGLLILSTLGLLNPSYRSGYVSVGTGLFVFAGVLSGYNSSRLYRTLNGPNERRNIWTTALLFPGLVFGFMFILNLFVWAQSSSTALPFSTLISLVALWLLM